MVVDDTLQLQGRCCCPLCESGKTTFYHTDGKRQYYNCLSCNLVFVPKRFHLTIAKEKALYDMHENSLEDAGYFNFLSRFSTPFLECIGTKKDLHGLDYGCGSAPALAHLFKKGGHRVALYDPIFHNDSSVLTGQYDFISSTEVVEHFREPAKDFKRLFGLLKRGGWLGIMTKMVRDKSAFIAWHYIRDRTHVCFFTRETFHYLGKLHGADVRFIKDDVIIFQKK